MNKKYIITENGAILFGDTLTHKEVAKSFSKILSAGFFVLSRDENECRYSVTVYGESVSLGIKSNPEDARKIEAIFNMY